MIDVSVCVPVYRAHPAPNIATLASDLPAALDGLAGELIVALNGIPPEAAGAPVGTELVPLPVNRGVAPGWNAAAARAHGATLCFANDDVRLGRGSLRMLHEALGRRPEAGVVGPVGTRWDVARAKHLAWLDLDGLAPGELRECEVVSGFLFATGRETFDAVRGFDEAYAPFSYEEADYCTAVRLDLGLACYAVAGVEHEHAFGVSGSWRPLHRVAFDGRTERVWRIDRRNRRHFLEKWSARATKGTP
jgi:GT2 family glycosyltransferase